MTKELEELSNEELLARLCSLYKIDEFGGGFDILYAIALSRMTKEKRPFDVNLSTLDKGDSYSEEGLTLITDEWYRTLLFRSDMLMRMVKELPGAKEFVGSFDIDDLSF